MFNEALVISDGYAAKAGTLTSGWDRFQPWETIDGDALAPTGSVQLEVLVERVKQNVTIDWQVRVNARAQIRVLVKRVLRKFGYPPDMQQRATELVLEQADVLCTDWSR